MPRDVFAELDSPEFGQIAVFTRIFFDQGWMRFLSDCAHDVVAAVLRLGTPTAAELGNGLPAAGHGEPAGLDAPAWSELEPWTDDALRELRASFPQEQSRARSADEANAEDRSDRDAKVAAVDSYATALGVRPPRTVGDLVEFLVACQLLITGGAGHTRYGLNPHPPLPAEVLPLTAEQRAAEDNLRWKLRYEPVAQQIIGLFQPNSDQPRDSLRTTLQRLARGARRRCRHRACRAHSAAGRPRLQRQPRSRTATRARNIEITADWEVFATTRIGVTSGPRGHDD